MTDKFNMTDKTDIEQHSNELRLSQLPRSMRASLALFTKELDTDGDGAIDVQEFTAAVKSLKDTRKSNKNLTKIVIALIVASLLLIGSVFGVSIAAARLAKDTVTDSSGVLQDKTTGAIVQTAGALVPIDKNKSIFDMSTEELLHMKEIVLEVKPSTLLGTLEPAGDDEVTEDEPAPKILMKKNKIDGVEMQTNGDVVLILKGGGRLTFPRDENIDDQRMELSDDLLGAFFHPGTQRQRKLQVASIDAQLYTDQGHPRLVPICKSFSVQTEISKDIQGGISNQWGVFDEGDEMNYAYYAEFDITSGSRTSVFCLPYGGSYKFQPLSSSPKITFTLRDGQNQVLYTRVGENTYPSPSHYFTT